MHATATKADRSLDVAAPELTVSQPTTNAVLEQTPLWAQTVATLQTKLVINAPGDRYEQEADRVADQVMRSPTLPVERKTCACDRTAGPEGMCEACKHKQLGIQRVASGSATQIGAPSIVRRVLRQPGRPLDTPTRNFMESRLGQNFGGVRIHADREAAASAQTINARAYTVGRHVVFGAREYAPSTDDGQRLLAHELTHVLQQKGNPNGSLIQRTGAGNCARPMETVDEQRDELARAGRFAHSQVQGFFAGRLSAEVPIPRATKALRTACPPPGTPNGRADLWRFGGGLSDVQVGEIKSFNGRRYAVPDVDHYRTRLRELAGRFSTGGPCPGPADASDRNFDSTWLDGNIARRRVPQFNALNSVIPSDTPSRLGPFWGDPLYKDLSCIRWQGGAVLYWCTNRRLSEDERERERVRLGIPQGERERRTAPQRVTRAPTLIEIHPGFREVARQLPGQVPGGRIFVVIAPDPLFTAVDGAMQMQRQMRMMQIPLQKHPIFQFRTIVWSTLAVVMAVGTMATIGAAIGAAAAVPAAAAVGGGAAAAGGGAAGGGVVIPLFATGAAAEEIAKAAAVVIVVGSLTAGASEAQAATAVQRGMSDPQVVGVVDITDDPFGLSGGFRTGSHITVGDRPYRVVGRFHSR